MTTKLHHIGIILSTEEDAADFAALMSLEEDYRGFVGEFECLCIFMKSNGSAAIELVVPYGGSLAQFNRGFGGIHHYALEVKDLDAVRDNLNARGMRLLVPEHVRGAGNFLCNFIDPRYTRGIMIEYVQLL
jgi:catechol 2,3-dioxygenase-like lactoylglutathione lyase family enzyme